MSWKKPLLAVVAFVIALEALLQLGAVAAAWLRSEPEVGGEILCVGDSYTFGIGATTPETSYPGQLQAVLRESIPTLRVDNVGLAGQDSRDVVAKLPRQWSTKTRVVCVLIGTNDSWRRPERAQLDQTASPGSDTTGFELRWRTGELLALLTRFEWGSWSESGRTDEPPVEGALGDSGASAESEASGAAADDAAAGFDLFESVGVIPASPRMPRFAVDADAPPQPQMQECWRLLHSGELPAASRAAKALIERHPKSASALAMFVQVAVQSGLRAEAEAALRDIESLESSTASPAATESLASALLWAGKPVESMRVAERRIRDEPLAVNAWQTLQQAAFSVGDAAALPAMAETLSLLGRNNPQLSGFIARNYARLSAKAGESAERLAALLVGATLLDGSLAATRLAAKLVRPSVAREVFDSVVVGLPESNARLRACMELIDEIYAGEDATQWLATLRDHLTQIDAFARAKGAKLVLLSYPFYSAQLEAEQRAIAEQLGAPFVAVRERFDRELKTRPRSELFIADGHCNDAGYRIVAELVAEVVVPLLRE